MPFPVTGEGDGRTMGSCAAAPEERATAGSAHSAYGELLSARSPQAQATLLCACALALGDVIAKLTEMQLLLAADDWGQGEAPPPAPPPVPGARTDKK